MIPPTFNNSYAKLPANFYAPQAPATVPAPVLVRLNEGLCAELALDPTWFKTQEGLAMLAGNTLPKSSQSIAMAYGGHQFGGWNPRLGDGRALLLGEVLDRNGIARDVQLKGSGRTAYSRSGDGKATLGAILREYVLSESMFALGIPTTRALAVVGTGEPVIRDSPMPGAILTRVAHSHVRVGTFQYFAAQHDHKSVRILADYVIDRHYPESRESRNPYAALLLHIIKGQAELIARWMQLGFIHGVMNTDNMQIAGETIDYGPCAFMDNFHPKCVFSSIDRNGRYAWEQQPIIAKWNLTRLAEALLSTLGEDQQSALATAEAALSHFESFFDRAFLHGFRRKLGLVVPQDKDAEFIAATLKLLAEQEVDFTLFFRRLTQVAGGEDQGPLLQLFKQSEAGQPWLDGWQARLHADPPAPRAAIMAGVNPVYIARNHRVEEAIAQGLEGNLPPFHQLVDLLQRPYQARDAWAQYENAPLEEEKVRETFCGT